jgi:spermidine/putrescine transport system permease protein
MTARRLLNPLSIYSVLVLLFLFAPVITVVVFSFDGDGTSTFPIHNFSTKWYEAFFDNPLMVSAAKNSAYVAAATAIVTSVLGTLAAFALVRYRVRMAGLLIGLIVLPIVLPALLLGVSLLSFFSKLNISLSLGTVIVGHVLVTLPIVVLTIAARLSNFDRSLEDAAGTLGASPAQTFRHVTFPLIRASLVGAALLVVAISLDEFIVTFFTIGSRNTLPIVIWGQMRAGVSPVVNAVSSLMLIATLLLVVVVRRLAGVRFR